MRSELSEQRLVAGAKRMRRVADQNTAPAVPDSSRDRNALDTAFENFTRIDVGSTPGSSSHTPTASNATTTTKAIIADIAAQLDALDRQRQRLSDLLRNVSI